MEVVNAQLDEMVATNALLPNGEMMNLHSLKSGVLLYGVSLEGDDSNRRLFYSPGDAILDALNRCYMRDTIGFASPEKPANHKNTDKFRFDSLIRLREYKFDLSSTYYDAVDKKRPMCSNVGPSNFRGSFNLRLPLGYDNMATNDVLAAKDHEINDILAAIIQLPEAIVKIRIQAMFCCEPGRSLRISNSFRIDMGELWTFYAAILAKGYTPLRIRNECFNGPKTPGVLASILSDKQLPVSIVELPIPVVKAIKEGESIDLLARRCALTIQGQRACVSGSFYKSLWARDTQSIKLVYPRIVTTGKGANLFELDINSMIEEAVAKKKLFNPYIGSWFYDEDFMAGMGRGDLAYNWNYNRLMDVGTVIYWVQNVMIANKLILPTLNYDPVKHASLIKHRFNDQQIKSMKQINLYDTQRQIRVEFSITGQGIRVKTVLLDAMARGIEIRQRLQKTFEQITLATNERFRVASAFKNDLNVADPELQILLFAPADEMLYGLPFNWFILTFLSSLLRYAITRLEFDFFSFAMDGF